MALDNQNVSIARVDPTKQTKQQELEQVNSAKPESKESNADSLPVSADKEPQDSLANLDSDTVHEKHPKKKGLLKRAKEDLDSDVADEKEEANDVMKHPNASGGANRAVQMDDKKNESESPLKTSAKAMLAAAATKKFLLARLLMMFRAYLRMLLAVVQTMIKSAIAGVVGLFHTITAGMIGAAATVGTAIGVSTTVAAVGMIGGSAAIVATTAYTIVVSIEDSIARKDDGAIHDCEVDVANNKQNGSIDIDVTQKETENVQKIYSILHEAGVPDINIAGCLGNWSRESGIDPTSIEGISGEQYNPYGAKKAEAFADMDKYTATKLLVTGYLLRPVAGSTGANYSVPTKPGVGSRINSAAYLGSDKKYYCGIGLGQYTGPAAETFLNFADSTNYEWYTIEAQMIYAISPNGYRNGWLGTWTEEENSVEDATVTFLSDWEGNAGDHLDEREEKAEYWYSEIVNMESNESYGKSIVEIAGRVSNDANKKKTQELTDDCEAAKQAQEFNNKNIANAAVSFAYATENEGKNNNGTELFRKLHDTIFPGDSYYMSCDRCVATAVRWSGADDEYPKGDVGQQLAYVVKSDKWQEITWSGDWKELSPGDILIRKDGTVSHTVVFTGNDAIARKYPEYAGQENYNIVSGSFGERSPGCGKWYTGSQGLQTYRVFRNIERESDSKYSHAAE